MSEMTSVLKELEQVPDPFSDSAATRLATAIAQASHIFVSGAGRSGLAINSFANRLLQMGFAISIIGELTTPHTAKNDLLIFNSASGSSAVLITQAQAAKQNGLQVAVITTDPNSKLALLADIVVVIQAQSKLSHTQSIQPMGALFEQYSWLFFDALVLRLMDQLKIVETTMRANHADLE